MKVLHIGQLVGGIEVYVRNTILYSSSDFEFVIVEGQGDKHLPIIRNGVEIKTYRIPLYRDLNPLKDGKALIQTIRIIREEKPGIIHCHSAKGGFIGRWAGFLTGIRVLYTPHAFSFLSTDSIIKKRIYVWLERLARLNSCLLACSESEQGLGRAMVHYRPSRALVWHNAVPDVVAGKLGCIDPGPFICCIGRPSYQKNTFFLLDVVKKVHARYPELKFYLLGVGYYAPDANELSLQIERAELNGTFVMVPWLSHEETLRYVKASLMYLTVSRYEGLPLAVLEAMASGKAIIASDVTGNRDCVRDGKNGYLLPMEVKSFTDAICLLIEDKNKRETMERNSRQLFEKEFLIDHQIGLLETIYKDHAKE